MMNNWTSLLLLTRSASPTVNCIVIALATSLVLDCIVGFNVHFAPSVLASAAAVNVASRLLSDVYFSHLIFSSITTNVLIVSYHDFSSTFLFSLCLRLIMHGFCY